MPRRRANAACDRPLRAHSRRTPAICCAGTVTAARVYSRRRIPCTSAREYRHAAHRLPDGDRRTLTQFERVQELVEDARRAGGTVEVGGAPLSRPGYFYPPTLVTGVGEGVRLVDEEQFGTALPVIPYADVDDAVAQANRSHYGLGGSVWTADVRRGEDIAQRLECGTAWVNQHIDTGAFAPFGGVNWGGSGRGDGRWGIEEFCELQGVRPRLA